jgi:hypothetical protein
MVNFTTTLLQFDEQGEKTGWTYIDIPADIAEQIKPNNKKSFRVKGKLDNYKIKSVALMPMGSGNFIMAVNAIMRKAIGKRKGSMINVSIEEDKAPLKLNEDFLACLNDEPLALKYFNSLAGSHRNYFSKWIDSAKTEQTKTKRIAMAISALSRNMGYSEMMREHKANRDIF